MRRKNVKAKKHKKQGRRHTYLTQAGGAQVVPQQKTERPLDLSGTVAVGAGSHLFTK